MAGMIDSSAAHPHGMPLQSPEKRRFDTITGSPSSPLALKRQQTDSPFTQLQSSHNLATLNLLQDSDTLDGAHETQGPVLYTFQDAVSLDSVAPCQPSVAIMRTPICLSAIRHGRPTSVFYLQITETI
jgi:hypothetical protein